MSVWLFGERDFPELQINDRQRIRPDELRVTRRTQLLIGDWLDSAGFQSTASPEETLASAVLAATAIARDLPSRVRVNISMRLSSATTNSRQSDWISLDVSRIE